MKRFMKTTATTAALAALLALASQANATTVRVHYPAGK
jgi:cobalamin biosynthesis protein CbiD